jgi:polygalacturonase
MRHGPRVGEGKDGAASEQSHRTAPGAGKRSIGLGRPMLGIHLDIGSKRTVLVLAVIAVAVIVVLAAILSLGMARPPATTPGTTHPIAPTPPGSIQYMRTVASVNGTFTVSDADGAVMHNGTDALDAIQEAIGSLTPGRSEKEAVLLQGDFVISGTIEVPSHTLLYLDGKVAWGGSGRGHMVASSSETDIEVQGGEWDGNRAERRMASENNPMEFIDCSNVVIANLWVHDGPYDNIECEDCTDVLISNVGSSSTNWNSILMTGCDNCVIENCHVHDSEQGGIYFYCEDDGIAQNINNNIIRGCLVERTVTSGLSFSIRGIEDRTDSGLIENNTCIDCGMDGIDRKSVV